MFDLRHKLPHLQISFLENIPRQEENINFWYSPVAKKCEKMKIFAD